MAPAPHSTTPPPRNAPVLCALPDARELFAVLGVVTTQASGWRHSIRRTWLAKPDEKVVTRLVLRGLNASAAVIDEAREFGDILFLPSDAAQGKDRGPLQSTWQWLECATSAWPHVQLIGKAEDDVWAHLPSVWESLRAGASMRHGRGRELWWGVCESYHWNVEQQRPIGFGHAFTRPVNPASWKNITVLESFMAAASARGAPRCNSADSPVRRQPSQVNLTGPFAYMKGPLYFLSRSLAERVVREQAHRYEDAVDSAGVTRLRSKAVWEDVWVGYAISQLEPPPKLDLVKVDWSIYFENWGFAIRPASLVLSMRYCLTEDRVLTLMGGVSWAKEMENIYPQIYNDTSTTVCKGYVVGADLSSPAYAGACFFRAYESSTVLIVAGIHAWLAIYGALPPEKFLLLVHLTPAYYLATRVILGDLDSSLFQRYIDTVYLYGLLLLQYLGARRTDLQHRQDFVHREMLEARNEQQAVRLEQVEEQVMAGQLPLSAHETALLQRHLEGSALPEQLQQARISWAEIQTKKLIGVGNFAEVHLATWRGAPCAVKRLRRTRLNDGCLKAFKDEGLLHQAMRHPNIVGFLGCAFDGATVCTVLELCARGTLEDLLNDPDDSPRLQWSCHKLPIAQGVARGMAYLHAFDPPVIHRDLKPPNILVDDGWNAKLADFGLSRQADLETTMSTAGSPIFSAPELLRMERYDEKVDVWSFACVLESLATHAMVYEASSLPLEQRVTSIAEGALRPSLPAGCFMADVIERCSHSDAEERPAFAALAEALSQPALCYAATLQLPGPLAAAAWSGKEKSTGGSLKECSAQPSGKRDEPKRKTIGAVGSLATLEIESDSLLSTQNASPGQRPGDRASIPPLHSIPSSSSILRASI